MPFAFRRWHRPEGGDHPRQQLFVSAMDACIAHPCVGASQLHGAHIRSRLAFGTSALPSELVTVWTRLGRSNCCATMPQVAQGCSTLGILSSSCAAWTFFVFRLLHQRRHLQFLREPLPALTAEGKCCILWYASRSARSLSSSSSSGPTGSRDDCPRSEMNLQSRGIHRAGSIPDAVDATFQCPICIIGAPQGAGLKASGNQHGDFLECLKCGQRWRRMKECCGRWLEIGVRKHQRAKPPNSSSFCRAHRALCSRGSESLPEPPTVGGPHDDDAFVILS